MTAKQRRFLVTAPDMIRRLRVARGLSVGQVAAFVGVSRVTIRNWERGCFGNDRGIPPERAVRLLRCLRLDPRYPEAVGRFTEPEAAHHDRVPNRSPAPWERHSSRGA